WATSRSSSPPPKSSAGTPAGKGWPGGNGGSGRVGAGQDVQASAPGMSRTGWEAMKPVHAETENGAVAEAGTASTAARYCARRVASAADLSHGNTLSAQNTA